MNHLKEVYVKSGSYKPIEYHVVDFIEHDMKGNQIVIKSDITISGLELKAYKKLFLRHNRTVLRNKAMKKALELIEVSDFYGDWESRYKTNLFKEKCYYTAFNFNDKLKEYFYNGDTANDIENALKENDINEAIEAITNGGDIYDKLRIKIESLIGKGNYVYDYYFFGKNTFSLYWFISKTNYEKTIKLIKSWLAYEEIDHLVNIN